jgi:hypothetical protein
LIQLSVKKLIQLSRSQELGRARSVLARVVSRMTNRVLVAALALWQGHASTFRRQRKVNLRQHTSAQQKLTHGWILIATRMLWGRRNSLHDEIYCTNATLPQVWMM